MALQSSDQYDGLDPSSRALMEKLDELLPDCTPKEVAEDSTYNAYGVDYMVGYEERKKASASNEKEIDLAVSEKACQVLAESQRASKTSAEPFRILSVGCGDGTFDVRILQAMISKYPDIKIDYTGTDIDEANCQKAIEELSALKKKLNDKVEIKIITMDMHSFNVEIPPCDLILAMRVLYYAMDVRKVISDVHSLLKTDGHMFILLATPDYPGLITIFRRFWLHERGWPLKLSDSVTDNLDTLRIKYKTELIYAEMDITDCFRDEFQKPHQKLFLNFMTHTKLERYPPEISQLCIEYLASVAIGKPQQYLIPYSSAFIVCKNE